MSLPLIFLSLYASARGVPNAYDLSVQLTRDGKSLVAPHLIVREGELRKVSVGANAGDFVEVRVTEGSATEHHGIYMEFRVGTKSSDGQRIILSRPRIMATENEPATITVGDGGRSTLSLSAIARRQAAVR